METISFAELQRQLGQYEQRDLGEPVQVTREGRESLVVMSGEEYRRLKRRDRKVFAAHELPPEFLAAIMAAEMPEEYAYLDRELMEPAAPAAPSAD